MKLWNLKNHPKTLQKLYDNRKALMREIGQRSRWSIGLGIVLAAAAMLMLLVANWVPTDHSEYINSQTDLFSIDNIDWYTSNLQHSDCMLNADCLERSLSFEKRDLAEIDQLSNVSDSTMYLYLNFWIPEVILSKLSSHPTLTVGLPRFRYEKAELFLDGESAGKFYRSERIHLTLAQSSLQKQIPLSISIVMEILPSERTISGERNHSGLIVASQGGYQAYIQYLNLKSSGAVGSMGNVAKIVLALFCLLLFLIVDSSPESLGLALFMGFEALALGIGLGWLPLGWFQFDRDIILSNYCFQMGDILKVYFFLQLARIGKPGVGKWLIYGTMLSIPYGFFMEYAYEHSFTWQYKIPRTRDTLSGLIGIIACAQALYGLRGQTLPWRKSALMIGCASAFIEISKSWVAHSDIHSIYPAIGTVYSLLEANLGYLFALSTFLNISTLENRVKTLTIEKERANEIKRQMELGQSLQKAFLTLPVLPADVHLTCFHEAAVYVSGDTYFVHWDQGRNVVTFLLNDVTGVGVQAALKAFAGNVIARTIWVDSAKDIRRREDRRRQLSNLERYDALVDQLLCQNSFEATDDFNAMIGAEFNAQNGEIELYRANYNFPYIASPDFDWSDSENEEINLWKFEKVQLQNRQCMTVKLKPGSFVIFVSDGYIESSRAELSFLRAIQRNISSTRESLNTTMLQSFALNWAAENGKNLHSDDRTVMVFQWAPKAESASLELDHKKSESA